MQPLRPSWISAACVLILSSCTNDEPRQTLTSVNSQSRSELGQQTTPPSDLGGGVALTAAQPLAQKRPPAPAQQPKRIGRRTITSAIDEAAACAQCHPEATQRYVRSPMGRASHAPRQGPLIEDFNASQGLVDHPALKVQYRALIDPKGRWWQEERVPVADFVDRVEVTRVIGTGAHSRAYLGERDGETIHLPLTWFSSRKAWGLTPGFEGTSDTRFSKPVQAGCLYCHGGLEKRSQPDRNKQSWGGDGISCARCHGDATAHIKTRLAGDGPAPGQPDHTIVNPGRLPAAQGERICAQCHQHGAVQVLSSGQKWDTVAREKPLGGGVHTYVWDGEKETSHPGYGARLARSACAQRSPDIIGCAACHNPHSDDPLLALRSACVSCHSEAKTLSNGRGKRCGSPEGQSSDALCAKCHMAPSGGAQKPHFSFTDHFIRTRPKGMILRAPRKKNTLSHAGGPKISKRVGQILLGKAYAQLGLREGQRALMARAQKIFASKDVVKERDLEVYLLLGKMALHRGEGVAALSDLAKATLLAPGNVEVLLRKAEALLVMGKPAEAELMVKQALELKVNNRDAWPLLAQVYQALQNPQAADSAWSKAMQLRPHHSLSVSQRGFNALDAGQITAAERFFARALDVDPLNEAAPFGLAPILAQKGHLQAAEGVMMQTALLHPTLAPAHLFLARFALARDDLNAAVARYQAAIKHDPKGPTAHLELIGLAYEAGQFEAAAQWRARALVEIPGLKLPPPPPSASTR